MASARTLSKISKRDYSQGECSFRGETIRFTRVRQESMAGGTKSPRLPGAGMPMLLIHPTYFANGYWKPCFGS